MTTTYRTARLLIICITIIILCAILPRDEGDGGYGCWDEPNMAMPNMYERICGDLTKMPVRSIRAPLPPYTEEG